MKKKKYHLKNIKEKPSTPAEAAKTVWEKERKKNACNIESFKMKAKYNHDLVGECTKQKITKKEALAEWIRESWEKNVCKATQMLIKVLDKAERI